MAIIVVAGRVVMRPVFRVVATLRSTELFLASVLFVIIGAGFVAAVAGLSMTLGAFVAGLLLAETAYRKAVEQAPMLGEAWWSLANLKTLRSRGHAIVEPAEGMLACGYEGIGRLAEIPDILAAIQKFLPASS